MNSILIKMEKDVISLLFREYPDLQIQINNAHILNREFTGCGFFTDYNRADIMCEEEMTISDVGCILNNSIEVGFVFFLRKDVACLECYAYEDDFPDQIQSYELYIQQQR